MADLTVSGPFTDWTAHITEDGLTDSIFNNCALESGFTGTKADARTLARVMLAGHGLLDAVKRLEAGVRLWISRGVSEEDMELAKTAIAEAEGA